MSDERLPTLRKLRLENFCGFSAFEMELLPLTVLIGPNSGGKTTILRAVKFLMDFLEIALPTYEAAVQAYFRGLQQLEDKGKKELGQLEENLRVLVTQHRDQSSQLAQHLRTREAATTDQECNRQRSTLTAKQESRRREYLEKAPPCACEMGPVAKRQCVESMDTFFFRHSKELVPVLMAELEAASGVIEVALRILRQEGNTRLAVASIVVAGRPFLEADQETRGHVLEALRSLRCDYVEPVCNLLPSEPAQSWPNVQSVVEKGRPNEVWRNHMHWLVEGSSPEAFQRVIERIRQSMPTVAVNMPRRTRDSQPKVVVNFDEDGTTYDVAESGSGFKTLLSIAARIELSTSPVLLLDEPDAHLHSAVQRELCDFIAGAIGDGRQIIMATHSPDMIDHLPLESLTWVDRKEAKPRRCDNATAVLVELGAVVRSEALGQPECQALLYFEGKPDTKVITSLCARMGDASWLTRCRLADLGGVGDAQHLPSVLRFLKQHNGREYRAAVVRDGDYRYTGEPTSTPGEGVLICYLPCKEIENLLLLQPKALWRAVWEAAQSRARFARQSATCPDESQVEGLINEIAADEALKEAVSDHWIVSKVSELPKKLDVDDLRRAKTEFEALWKVPENRLRFGPGKRILSMVRTRIQSKYKISLPSLPRLFEFYELPEDVAGILKAVKEHLTPTP